MGREIKRGGPFPGPRSEARELGPYPIWDAWRPVLLNYLRERDIILLNGTDEILHEFYDMRRQHQRGDFAEDEFKRLTAKFSERYAEIIDRDENLTEALRFISNKTQASDGKTLQRR